MSAFRSILVWLGLSSPAQAAGGDAVFVLPAYEDTMLLAEGAPATLRPPHAGATLAPAYEDTMLLAGFQPRYVE